MTAAALRAREPQRAAPPRGAVAPALALPASQPTAPQALAPQPTPPQPVGNAAAARLGGAAPPPAASTPAAPAPAAAVGNGAQAAAAAPAGRLVCPPAPDPGAAAGPIQGLRSALPSAAATAFGAAETQAAGLLAGERARLAANAPATTAPTGLPNAAPPPPAAGEAGPPRPASEAAAVAPVATTAEPEAAAPPPAAAAPAILPGAGAAAVAAASVADTDSGLATIIAPIDVAALLARAQGDDSVDTSAGERPTIALTDELDPAQASTAAAPRDAATAAADAQAAIDRAADSGIDAIGPSVVPRDLVGAAGAVAPPGFGEPLVPEEIPADVAAGFDQVAAGRWGEATAQAAADHDAAFAKRAGSEAQEWAATEAGIADAEAKATADQQGAIATARGEAAAGVAAWDADIAAARTTYQGSRQTALDTLHRDVEQERLKGEGAAAAQLDAGEQQARAAELETRGKVADERAKVERESEQSDGFLDWLADAVSDLFDALADFVNDAFNALRGLVSDIIDGAKRLARAAINLARDAINGVIRLAAGALELAADVFLAAFPEAHDRAVALIHQARDTAIDAVNSAADWLATQVDQLLDALGAALDFILSVYQRAYLAILNAIRALVLGFIEIMRGIARLVDAARAMPEYFEGEVETELIGQDLTQPLFFERTADALPMAPAGPDGAPEPAPAADLALTAMDRLAADQVTIDAVADFTPDPAFFAAHPLADGSELEFAPEDVGAGSEPPIGGMPATGPESGAATTTADDVGATDKAAGIEAAAPAEPTTDERLQRLMDAEPSGACEASSAPTSEAFPEAEKFGPLTRGQRARYLLSQMGKGIRQWFACNWPWVLAASVAALVGAIALVILTGGLITAALPVLLEILAAVMIGAAVFKAATHIGDYLAKGWGGDIQGGGRSLAKGLAVGAVELIFAVLTYITAGAFRALSAGLKAVGRVAGAAARGVGRAGRTVARLARAAGRRIGAVGRRMLKAGGRAGRALVVRGRLVIRGLKRGFARGVKSVRDLAKRIGAHFRFRRFKIVRRGKWVELWGEINPWLRLATGNIEWVDKIERNVSRSGKKARIGDEVVGRTASGSKVTGKVVGGSKNAPDPRSIIDIEAGRSVSVANVIHHSVEQQILKRFPKVFTLAEINAGRMLRAIQRGVFNSAVHLSQIRRLWNLMYTRLTPQFAKLGKAGAKQAILAYRDFVDDYIRAMVKYAETNRGFARALELGDKDLARRLLEARSEAWWRAAKPDEAVTRILKEAGGG